MLACSRTNVVFELWTNVTCTRSPAPGCIIKNRVVSPVSAADGDGKCNHFELTQPFYWRVWKRKQAKTRNGVCARDATRRVLPASARRQKLTNRMCLDLVSFILDDPQRISSVFVRENGNLFVCVHVWTIASCLEGPAKHHPLLWRQEAAAICDDKLPQSSSTGDSLPFCVSLSRVHSDLLFLICIAFASAVFISLYLLTLWCSTEENVAYCYLH